MINIINKLSDATMIVAESFTDSVEQQISELCIGPLFDLELPQE